LKRGLKAACRWLAATWLAPTEMAPVDWRRTCFTSAKLRQRHVEAGVPVGDNKVIYWGVPVDQFTSGAARTRAPGEPLRLLFAGRLEEVKGAHTILEALPGVRSPYKMPVDVTIVGEGSQVSYLQRLKDGAGSLSGSFAVHFTGKVPTARMREVSQAHDVLIFPSIWDEPFSITVLEAMAASLCVVGTTTGGSAEILREDVNSLTF